MLLSTYLSVHMVWTKGSMKDLDEHLVGDLLFHGVRSHGDAPGVWMDHLKPSWVASALLGPSDVYTHMPRFTPASTNTHGRQRMYVLRQLASGHLETVAPNLCLTLTQAPAHLGRSRWLCLVCTGNR